MRCVLRCLALPTNQLWHSAKSHQSLFMPQHLYITHIIFHAVHPEICHQSYQNHTFDETRCLNPAVLLQSKAGRMKRYSGTAILGTLATMSEDDEYPVIARVCLETPYTNLNNFVYKPETYLKKGHISEFVNFRKPRIRLGIFKTSDLRFLLRTLYPKDNIHSNPNLSMVT